MNRTNNTQSSLLFDAIWIFKECWKVVLHPMAVVGGFLDIARGWGFTRNWLRFWLSVPSAILLLSFYVMYAVSALGRNDSMIQRFVVESEARCATKTLEGICNQPLDSHLHSAFGFPATRTEAEGLGVLTDLTKRYIELLSKRVLSIENNNQYARYRLALIYRLTDRTDLAKSEMLDLANGKYGEFPQSNAWVAKDLLLAKVRGEEVSLQDIVTNLETATKWKDVDYRILMLYSRFLDQTNNTTRAIEFASRAASVKPEMNLELVRLYAKINENIALRDAAMIVEELHRTRLNTSREIETDRLAIAEACRLTNRLDQAIEVLREGLTARPDQVKVRRELSECERLVYKKSKTGLAQGGNQIDLTLLEKSAETDPSNPNISEEIALLLPLKIKPSKKLMDLLKRQVELGITSPSAHMILAEGYYAMGSHKEAMKHWELGLAKDPNNVIALNNLGLCIAKQSQPDLERSLELMSKALSLSPNNPELLDSLGEVLIIANRHKEAINKLEMAIRQDPKRTTTRKKLVIAYKAVGMNEMADAQLKFLDSMEQSKNEDKPR